MTESNRTTSSPILFSYNVGGWGGVSFQNSLRILDPSKDGSKFLGLFWKGKLTVYLKAELCKTDLDILGYYRPIISYHIANLFW